VRPLVSGRLRTGEPTPHAANRSHPHLPASPCPSPYSPSNSATERGDNIRPMAAIGQLTRPRGSFLPPPALFFNTRHRKYSGRFASPGRDQGRRSPPDAAIDGGTVAVYSHPRPARRDAHRTRATARSRTTGTRPRSRPINAGTSNGGVRRGPRCRSNAVPISVSVRPGRYWKTATCSGGHAPSQGIVPLRRRSRIASWCAWTSMGCLVSGPGPAGTSRFAPWPGLPRGCRAGAGRRAAGPRRFAG
jgi:hypothetical protein